MKKWLEIVKRNETASCRLFCFHHGGAGAAGFYPWAKMLPDTVELVAIQLPGRETRFGEPYLTSVADVIAGLFDDMAGFLEKPMIFFGHSLGGLLAFELTRKLRAATLPLPKHLVISGCKAPHLPLRREPIANLSEDKLIAKLVDYNGIPQIILDDKDGLLSLFLPIIRADFTLVETYRHEKTDPLSCHITALSGKDDFSVLEEDVLAWKSYTTLSFCHFSMSGDHFFIKSAQAQVVDIIKQIIAQTVAEVTSNFAKHALV